MTSAFLFPYIGTNRVLIFTKRQEAYTFRVGMHHSNSMLWNDGTSGVTSIPILARANFTAILNTTNDWGLKWYLDHTSTPSVDGNYGTIWIRPSAERERPYHLVSNDIQDIQQMIDAEATPEHVIMYNYQHREMPGLLYQLQAEGYDPYCFQSVLINGECEQHMHSLEKTSKSAYRKGSGSLQA